MLALPGLSAPCRGRLAPVRLHLTGVADCPAEALDKLRREVVALEVGDGNALLQHHRSVVSARPIRRHNDLSHRLPPFRSGTGLILASPDSAWVNVLWPGVNSALWPTRVAGDGGGRLTTQPRGPEPVARPA